MWPTKYKRTLKRPFLVRPKHRLEVKSPKAMPVSIASLVFFEGPLGFNPSLRSTTKKKWWSRNSMLAFQSSIRVSDRQLIIWIWFFFSLLCFGFPWWIRGAIFAGFGGETGDKPCARRMVPAACLSPRLPRPCRHCLLLHVSKYFGVWLWIESAGLLVGAGVSC